MNGNEFHLPDLVAARQYPQVLRVTRNYCVNGSQYLSEGQYITVVDRRKVELIKGTDGEGREFKVRRDRSAQVEVIEDERIVYSLGVIVEYAKDIEAIELRKEVRLDKITFESGEIFTVEKMVKNYRGRPKNIELKRLKDDRVHKFPLDLIGLFKLHTGKSLLPLSRILSLRTLPLKVQFRNTPTSSNFPTGIVTLHQCAFATVVNILTVSSELYTYETFPADAPIYVTKCTLKHPKPIRDIIPSGLMADSAEFQNETKRYYKRKMNELDSKLIEDIFAADYYGSATLEKPPEVDRQLLMPSLALGDGGSTSTASPSPTPSTPESETNPRPAPFPRYSKKRQRNSINIPALQDHLQKSMEHLPNRFTICSVNDEQLTSPEGTVGSQNSYLTENSSVRSYASRLSSEKSLGRSSGPSSYGCCSGRSARSNLSSGRSFGVRSSSTNILSERIYQAPEASIMQERNQLTENSGDSGVGLSEYPFYTKAHHRPSCEVLYENTSREPTYESLPCMNADQEIMGLSQNEVSNLLVNLNMPNFVDKFQQELVNGKLLPELDEKTLVEDLAMTKFEAFKLHRYVHGWRPSYESTLDQGHPSEWSVEDVRKGLQRINLHAFGMFCENNKIDGRMLMDVAENQHLIDSIKKEHSVNFSGLELSRLKAFVLKDWRPDDTVARNEKPKQKPAIWNRLMPSRSSSSLNNNNKYVSNKNTYFV